MGRAQDIRYFREALLGWFALHGREFPWREEGLSNYRLILSEVLLQRTRAETVVKHYHRFFSLYPDWKTLGDAGIAELEDFFRPLGLHRQRASRLYRMAQEFKAKGGNLPRNKHELQESSLSSLYLAGAYELFVLRRRKSLLDVNMARLLSRFFSPREKKDVRHDKQMQAMADAVTRVKKCRELNWAILDYAALVCKARNPLCQECLLRKRCSLYLQLGKELG